MIFTSPYPRAEIPSIDFYTFVTSATYDDSKGILLDHFTQETRSLRQVKDGSKRIARGLREKHDFGKGSIMALVSDNHIDYGSIALGAIAAGGACMTVNSEYNAEEMAHQLSNSKAEIIVTTESLVETVKKAIIIAGTVAKSIYVLDNVDSPNYLWTALASKSAEMNWTLDAEEYAECPAILIYSSGTTGKPKGVQLTHRNLVAHLAQYGVLVQDYGDILTKGTVLNTSPMCYISGVFMIILALLGGETFIILPQKYTFDFLLSLVDKYRIGSLAVPPNAINLLSKSPLTDKYDLSCLKQGHFFGGPMSRDVCNIVQDKFDMTVGSLYGMTECCGGICIRVTDYIPADSVGCVMPNFEIKIIDEDGKPLGVGERGEICARGPSIMKGYFNNPDATHDAFDVDGFYHTGDIGYMDDRHALYIVDRIKEIIKYDNNQVAPAELEEHLLLHPAVSEAAVIGYPSEKEQTELPCGCVVLKDMHDPHPDLAGQIADHVNDKVVDYKKLRAGVVFVDHIPRNSHGKILRRILRTQLQETHPLAAIL
ncbi:hypothetical protein K7432_015508 [Basidiobolus ranarum]|uniref:4-coumarate--CoA ligase n=1 Tax=Basidiobolus ranarum TaxID=34480 RepID=A0ABR2VN60_9FUNG